MKSQLPLSPSYGHVKACAACVLCDYTASSKLSTPFAFQRFDFSDQAFQAATRVITEGEQKLYLLEDALERITLARDNMRRVVQQHRNLLAPVQRLTDDVLLLIFRQLPQRSTEDGKHNSPWIASAVCKRWRDLSLSHPSLWVDILLEPRAEDSFQDIQLQCRRANLQLARTGACPLEMAIHLHAVYEISNVASALVSDTVRDLLASSHRCRALELNGQIPFDWDVVPEVLPPFKSLEMLCLEDDSWTRKPFFRNAPKLETLRLERLLLYKLLPVLCWSNISELTLDQCSGTVADFLEVLRLLASQLDGLVINQLWPVNDEDEQHAIAEQPFQPVHLPRLRCLNISSERHPGPSASLMQSIIHHTRAPNLSCLHVSHVTEDDFDALRQLICGDESDHKSRLKKLEIEKSKMGSKLLTLLPALGALVDLSIKSWRTTRHPDSVLDALRRRQQSTSPQHSLPEEETSEPDICPNLTKLTLSRMALDPGLLESMVRSRAKRSTKDFSAASPRFLEVVHLDKIKLTGSSSNIQWLEDMKRDGLLNLGSKKKLAS